MISGAEDLVPVLNPDGSPFEEQRDPYRVSRYRPRIEGTCTSESLGDNGNAAKYGYVAFSGVLSEQGGAWWYERHLGGGQFGPQQLVAQKAIHRTRKPSAIPRRRR